MVARCLQPGVSVSGIAIGNGLNLNLVRKSSERAHRETHQLAPLLPAVLADPQAAVDVALAAVCIEIAVSRS